MVVVRRAESTDIDRIMPIYEFARRRMAQSGNPHQWIDGYPSRDVVAGDIACGNCYVVEAGGEITGVFAFIVGDDPTYAVIEGSWLNDNEYGTIHRIASAPGAKGIADICLEYCKTRIPDIRIDTHRDNAPMLGWIRSRGFSHCGMIYCHNGTAREAFQISMGGSAMR